MWKWITVVAVCTIIGVLGFFVYRIYVNVTDLFGPSPSRESTPQAPIVLNIDAWTCNISSTGNYALVKGQHPNANIDPNTIYNLHSGEEIILPESLGDSYNFKATWIDHDVLFISTQNKAKDPIHDPYDPANGWIIDINTLIMTDVLKLELPSQKIIIKEAFDRYQQDKTQFVNNSGHLDSPDGTHWVNFDVVIHDNHGRILNVPSLKKGWGEMCLNGWKPDSSGVYFVQIGGLRKVPNPGPIRFLPVTPPK